MKNIRIKISLIIFCFVLVALLPSITLAGSINGKASGPERLTSSQMDIITAGTTAVMTNANAIAYGDPSSTYTKTNTYAFSTPGNIVQVGLGRGFAYANGSSDTDANVNSDYYSDGAIVVGKSFEIGKSNPHSSWAIGGVVAIGINPPLTSH